MSRLRNIVSELLIADDHSQRPVRWAAFGAGHFVIAFALTAPFQTLFAAIALAVVYLAVWEVVIQPGGTKADALVDAAFTLIGGLVHVYLWPALAAGAVLLFWGMWERAG